MKKRAKKSVISNIKSGIMRSFTNEAVNAVFNEYILPIFSKEERMRKKEYEESVSNAFKEIDSEILEAQREINKIKKQMGMN